MTPKDLTEQYINSLKETLKGDYNITIRIEPEGMHEKPFADKKYHGFGTIKTRKGLAYSYLGKLATTDK